MTFPGFYRRPGFYERGTFQLPTVTIDGDLDVNGVIDEVGAQRFYGSPIAGQDTSPLAYASNRTVAFLLGQCDSTPDAIDAIAVLGTAGVTITWAEIGLAVGDPNPLANPTSLTPIGWASVAAEGAVGSSYVMKALTMSRMPRPGEFLWGLVSNVAATPITWRVANGSEGSGMLVYRDNFRPSTNLGTAGDFTLDTATVALPPQFRLAFGL